jgi:hypothetical protein
MTKIKYTDPDGVLRIKIKGKLHVFPNGRVGSRDMVRAGTALKTAGGLYQKDLTYNPQTRRVISLKKHITATKDDRLRKHGFVTRKGKFGNIRKGKTRKHKGKSRGGDANATGEQMATPASNPITSPAPAASAASNPVTSSAPVATSAPVEKKPPVPVPAPTVTTNKPTPNLPLPTVPTTAGKKHRKR